MSLWSDFLANSDRQTHKWTNYFPIYETYLNRYVNRPVLLVEIGVSNGGSLQLWKRFLGPFAQIVGLDINEKCKAVEEDQIAIRIGEQQDTSLLDSVLSEFGVPDVIIDDGSHRSPHVIKTFQHLYPKISKDGIYMVEDVHTSYWAHYGGGYKAKGSFIELCKDYIDEINAAHPSVDLTPTAFTKQTVSMHFYDSMVVFQKGMTKKRALITGNKVIIEPGV